jgi:uncharacterized protein YeaO (DUF488 family)
MAKRSSDICIKRAYDPPEESDGARVLVDRLWPRGLRKESADLTLWFKDIAPSSDLRKWFGHDPARWTEFSRRYRAELSHNEDAVDRLVDMSKNERLTLLYAAHDIEHNDAVVLADYLRRQLKKS